MGSKSSLLVVATVAPMDTIRTGQHAKEILRLKSQITEGVDWRTGIPEKAKSRWVVFYRMGVKTGGRKEGRMVAYGSQILGLIALEFEQILPDIIYLLNWRTNTVVGCKLQCRRWIIVLRVKKYESITRVWQNLWFPCFFMIFWNIYF